VSYGFPEGSHFYFTNTLATAIAVASITNASPAVATSTAHGLADGAEVLFTSAWEDASDSVFRVGDLTADTFSLLGLNTTDENLFAPGGGVGTVQLASEWIEIPQVLTIDTSGGDAKFTTITPLARRNALNIPTGFNATSITLTLGHDASNENYLKMLDISRSLSPVAFKMVLANGAASYGYGYMSVSEMPKLTSQQANQVTAAFSLQGRSISYGVPAA
jgi:Phage tail tube protein, TTP